MNPDLTPILRCVNPTLTLINTVQEPPAAATTDQPPTISTHDRCRQPMGHRLLGRLHR